MVIVFVTAGILFGASAAVFTLLSGGSFLFALAAYSGFGIVGAVGAIMLILIFGNNQKSAETWQCKPKPSSVSA